MEKNEPRRNPPPLFPNYGETDGGWIEWKRLFTTEMTRIAACERDVEGRLRDLEVKAAVHASQLKLIGFISGLIAGGLVSLLFALLRQ